MTAITGVFLLFFYKPSMTQVTYHGSYHKLDGVQMSQAYRSTLDISFDVRAGLLMRQIHNWASLMFIAAVCLHLLRLYFTGAFPRRRWLDWVIWVTLLTLLDRKLTGDRAVGQFLDRPREAATRTAIGAAGITFYGLLWAAAANDEIADHARLSLFAVIWFFRVAVLAGPVLAFAVTRRMCLGLTARDRDEAGHGRETGRIVMDPAGGYREIREPVRPGVPRIPLPG